MKKINNKLFTKVFIGYIFILVFVLGIISSTLIIKYNNIIKQNKLDYNVMAISKISTAMEQYNIKLNHLVNYIHQQVLNEDIFTNKENIDNSFETIKSKIKFEQGVMRNSQLNQFKNDIAGILIYIDDNNYHYMGEGDIKGNIDIVQQDWYKTMINIKNNNVMIGPYYQDYLEFSHLGDGDNMVMIYGKKFNIGKKQVDKQPFIMLAIRLDNIVRIIEDFFDHNQQAIVILDKNDDIIYSSHPDLDIPLHISEDKFKKDNKTYIVNQQYINEFGWRIVYASDLDELLEPANKLRKETIIFLLLGGIIAFSISLLITYYIVTPIEDINKSMKKVKMGDFDVEIDVRSNDEIGQLAISFNEMVREIETLINKVYVSQVRETEASIMALQAQINPHFLYNTLENISSIAQVEEVDMIADISQGLARMFRYSIEGSTQYASIKDELDHVRTYINIINIRFDDKIEYIEDVDPNLYQYRIIKLFLQPLVENSVLHGIYNRPFVEGRISLSIHKIEEDIIINVLDNGVGIIPERLEEIRENLDSEGDLGDKVGIGLQNVQHRCKLNFQDFEGIQIESIPNEGTSIYVKFPAIKYDK